MFLGAIDLTTLQLVILLTIVILFTISLYLFVTSRKTLQNILPKSKEYTSSNTKRDYWRHMEEKEKEIEKLHKRIAILQDGKVSNFLDTSPKSTFWQKLKVKDNSPGVQERLNQQDQLLNKLKLQIEKRDVNRSEDLESENIDLRDEIEKLRSALEKKDEELLPIKQQEHSVQKLTSRLAEVSKEFDVLQQKILELESKAAEANDVAIELDDLKQTQEQILGDLIRKQEKLEVTVRENQRLHQQLSETEDKLAEANLQRQQLLKKVQYLEDVNADYQKISETNKKLQTEIRRIGELESMVSMLQEERDQLIQRRSNL